MPQNPFDKSCRYLARLDPAAFLGWTLGLSPERFRFRGWLDTRSVPRPGDPDRTGDTVARLDRLPGPHPPWAVAVEFQIVPDPDMFGRLLDYVAVLRLGLRPDEERGSRFDVGAAVVNLTGVGSASHRMEWSEAGLVTELGARERNLERESADELLAGVESGRRSRCLLPWVPLMAGADDPAIVDRWKALAEGEPDSGRRTNFGAIALVFAGRVGRKPLWETKLEGWNVEESTVLNEWIAKAEVRAEARGEARAAQSLVLRQGTKKFGPPSPAAEAAVRAVTDPDRLGRLADRILDATTWDELLATP